MHLTGLVKSLDHVCCRYRLAAFRPHLQSAGHRLDLMPWSPALLGNWLRPGKLSKCDVVVLQRLLLPDRQLAALRRQTDFMVFDFDDAIFLRDSYDVHGPLSPRRLSRFVRTIETADLLVTGNQFLAEQANRWVPDSRIHVIPTCLDADQYPCAEHREHEQVQLTWIGSASTLRGLERIAPLLEQLGRSVPGLALKIICDRPLSLQHLPVRFAPWSAATEATELAAGDIGIAWLPDDAWSRGKCGLKVLQYMAAGLPVIANPIGVQADLIEHGETGFLVRSPDDWLRAVETLAGSPSLRQKMGQRGRDRVKSSFDVHSGAAKWFKVLEEVPTRLTSVGRES